jgi:hypothetical protein
MHRKEGLFNKNCRSIFYHIMQISYPHGEIAGGIFETGYTGLRNGFVAKI